MSDLGEIPSAQPDAGAGLDPSGAGEDWLAAGTVCRMLGISPATLRRWANDGVIASHPTPGGHRRFPRSAVAALAPRQAEPGQRGFKDVASSDLIAQAYRRTLAGDDAHHQGFLEAVPSGARAPLREYGRVITSSILEYLNAPTDVARDAALAEGLVAAAGYGRIAATAGASMRETVAVFLHFRKPFVREMAGAARRRGLDIAGTTSLMEALTVAIDRLLDATLEGHEHGARRDTRR